MRGIILVIALSGCAYNGTQDPNIQFWDQPIMTQPVSPRVEYFSDKKEPVNYCAIYS